MCSNKKTLACLFDNQNKSILSDTYKKSILTINATNLDQIQIKFKNKYRLLTAIDEKTSFDDLKLALIISYYKKRLSASSQSEQSQLKKFQKNFENLKRIASEDYVICETTNGVEKMIDSSQRVREALKRFNKEAVFLKDFKVSHSMRLKRSLVSLSPETKSKCKVKESKKVPILEEFFIEDEKTEHAGYNPGDSSDIDKQLELFDKYIDQRKNYIKLLEEYLMLTDELEADFLQPGDRSDLGVQLTYDTESSDTGFSSVEDEVSGTDSISDRLTEWCNEKNVPEENRLYFTRISNFETYV